MQDYSKLLKNKNELSSIEKKISKIEFYLARLHDDMALIRKQAEDVREKKLNQDRQLEDKIQKISYEALSQLRAIANVLGQRVTSMEQNCMLISQRLNSLKDQQVNDKLMIQGIEERLSAMEDELGIQ